MRDAVRRKARVGELLELLNTGGEGVRSDVRSRQWDDRAARLVQQYAAPTRGVTFHRPMMPSYPAVRRICTSGRSAARDPAKMARSVVRSTWVVGALSSCLDNVLFGPDHSGRPLRPSHWLASRSAPNLYRWSVDPSHAGERLDDLKRFRRPNLMIEKVAERRVRNSSIGARPRGDTR